MEYTIKKLAEMAGVSVRTLHHYDAIGLVVPRSRSAAGYRLYGEQELLRLQHVLFYRELDMGLDEIGRTLDRPGFDPVTTLVEHRRFLEARSQRLVRLMETVDRTIGRLKGENMLSDQELYEGFSTKEIEAMKKEAEERWGRTEAYAQSRKRVAKMSKQDWENIRTEGAAVDEAAAEALRSGEKPGSAGVRAIMSRKFEHLRHFYEPSPELFAGLGRMYEEDERFKAHYEAIAPGLAGFLRLAMEAYAEGSVK